MGFDLFKYFLFRNFLIVERTWKVLLLWSSKLSHFLVHSFQRGTLAENVTLLITCSLSLWLWLNPCCWIRIYPCVFNLWHHLWSLARLWWDNLTILLLLIELALPQICLFLRLLWLLWVYHYHTDFVMVILSIYHTFTHAVMRLFVSIMSDRYS